MYQMLMIKWSALLYTNISLSNEPATRCTVIKSPFFSVTIMLFFFFFLFVFFTFYLFLLYLSILSLLYSILSFSDFHISSYFSSYNSFSPAFLSVFSILLSLSTWGKFKNFIIPRIKTFILWKPEIGSMFTRGCYLFLFWARWSQSGP